ncbi:MAG: VCBS repeat-containing protein [Akkermansiaceae bacterium]|nr:VCBS repeat-containing protein [Armatimonadota bacterium]
MPLKWTRRLIASEAYESAAVFDVNNDGHPDIVSGAFWYEGPGFKTRHVIGGVDRYDEYYDDFSTIAMDISGNGRLDFVTGGWWGGTLRWRENTGLGGDWPTHVIAETGNIETTRAWDVDSDGELEIVPNTPGGPLVVYKRKPALEQGGAVSFVAYSLFGGPQGHGLGFGDINGDGRGDFVLQNGWFEAPSEGDVFAGEWKWHPEFDLGGDASVPILVVDVNGDGLSDLIVGRSHGYGLDWWEQGRDTQGGRTWTRHPIDPFNSEYHDLIWVDIDGDGENELVTGKRYHAHPNEQDPGGDDDIGIYYFKWTGESFAKQVITYGPLGVGAGCGIHFAVADLRGTGRLDIVAPGKDGLHVFFNDGM